MTPPPRLRETSRNFSQVLAALRAEEPDPELRAKVLALSERSPSPSSDARNSSLVRWLVVGTAALTLMGIGWALREDRRTSSIATPASAPATETATATAEGPTPQPEVGSTVSVDDLPIASPAAPSGAALPTPKAGATASNDGSSTFHEELALVEAARAALARGDGESCLRTLDRYDARFRGGVLAAEADITRIEAWSSLGQTEKARALADRFLAENATNPYAPRVRAVRAKLGAREQAR